jgi:hypothetical protein
MATGGASRNAPPAAGCRTCDFGAALALTGAAIGALGAGAAGADLSGGTLDILRNVAGIARRWPCLRPRRGCLRRLGVRRRDRGRARELECPPHLGRGLGPLPQRDVRRLCRYQRLRPAPSRQRRLDRAPQCRAELLSHGHGNWSAREVDLALFTHGRRRGFSETTAVATAAGIPDYQETASLSHHPARRRTTTRLRQGSGYEQAEAELCRVEVDKVAVALGPLA